MKTTTNRNWRQFIYGYDVPAKVLKDFDHLSEDDKCDGWINYKRTWYHISDFLRTNQPGWDGAHSHSWSYAVVIKLHPGTTMANAYSIDASEMYQIGTLIS